MIYLQLFFEFFKAGLFAIGGGLATLPFLYDMSQKTNWFSEADIANMIAISQSTPGPIGVNMATYTGFTTGNLLGSIVATLGLVCPSIIIIIIVAHFLNKFKENSTVQSVFYGLRPASTALIAAAGYQVVKITLFNLNKLGEGALAIFNWKCILLALVLFFIIKKSKKHPVIFIAASAVIGIIFKLGI